MNHVLSEPALQFGATPAKTDILPETDVRDRVCNATADVFTNPTHWENPAGKLNRVDDFVMNPRLNAGSINLLALLPFTPHGFPFIPCGLESKK
jgi:hypothetical protein